jgi:hypothetical protein
MTPVPLALLAAATLALTPVLAIAATTSTPAAASSTVEVRFIEPEKFTDVTPGSAFGTDRERAATLAELRGHLTTLGARHLRPSDRLTIDVLVIDLAGHFEPWRSRASDVRYLLPVTWPRVTMRTTLERAGERIEREEHIADLDYQRHALACRGGDRLCYEKRMLDNWFERRFGARGE